MVAEDQGADVLVEAHITGRLVLTASIVQTSRRSSPVMNGQSLVPKGRPMSVGNGTGGIIGVAAEVVAAAKVIQGVRSRRWPLKRRMMATLY